MKCFRKKIDEIVSKIFQLAPNKMYFTAWQLLFLIPCFFSLPTLHSFDLDLPFPLGRVDSVPLRQKQLRSKSPSANTLKDSSLDSLFKDFESIRVRSHDSPNEVVLKKPAASRKPAVSQKPVASRKPAVTRKPAASQNPSASQKPTASRNQGL